MLLLLLLLIFTASTSFETDYFSQVISSLRQALLPKCTYLTFDVDSDLKQKSELRNIVKYSSKNFATIGLLPNLRAEDFKKLLIWQYCRPFYVMFENMKSWESYYTQVTKFSNAQWLLFLDNASILNKALADVSIQFDCEFLVAQPKDNITILTEVYKVSPTFLLQTYKFGNWTPENGLVHTTEHLYQRRNSLQGLKLKSGFIGESLTATAKEHNNKPEDVKGYNGDIWHTLQSVLNFSSDYYKPQDNSYGTQQANSTWNGLVGMLIRDEIHVAVSSLFWEKARTFVVDFITPTQHTRSYIYVKEPDMEDATWNAFLMPFSSQVWVTLIICVIAVSILLSLTGTVWRYLDNGKTNDSSNFSFLRALFSTVSAFCLQEHDKAPFFLSGRLIRLVTYLAAVVVLTSYSAFLISRITTLVHTLPFNSMEEMLDDGTYTFGITANSSYNAYFKQSENSVLKRAYNTHIVPAQSSLPTTIWELMELICYRYKYAGMLAETSVLSYENKVNCDMMKVPKAFMEMTAAMAIKKRSPYLQILKLNMRAMLRSGLMKVIRNRNNRNKIMKFENTFDSVTLAAVIPILIFLATGVIASALLLIMEILWSTKINQKKF